MIFQPFGHFTAHPSMFKSDYKKYFDVKQTTAKIKDQPNFDRKTGKFHLVEKKLRHP
jgi:hypothetical protein